MGTTTKMAIPYPEATGLVKDGWEDMKDIATQVDAKSGLVLLNTTTFSAVSSQSINNVFNANFDNYRLLLEINSTSAAGMGVGMRLRVSGSDNSSANYWNNRLLAQTTTVASSGATSADTSWTTVGEFETSNATFSYDLYAPFKTSITSIIGNGQFRYTSFYQHTQIKSGQTTVTTSYDGFTLIATTGTMTGQVRIYGYNQ